MIPNIRFMNSPDNIDTDHIIDLFGSVDWDFETKSSELIIRALYKSSHIVAAWHNDRLIGIARSMDDGLWSANIDCVVVHSEYQHNCVGMQLMMRLLDMLRNMPYINLSPNDAETQGFYEKFGFVRIDNGCLMQKTNI